MSTEHRLHFPQLDREIHAREDESLFHSARRHGLRIVGACGGRGTCGTCVVQVVDGDVEHQASDDLGDAAAVINTRKKKWLRACQVRARSACTVEVAPRSLAPVVRAEAQGSDEQLALDAAVVGHELRLTEATLDDTRSDLDRLVEALGQPLTIDLHAARQLPGVLRKNGWALRAFVRQQGNSHELIGVAPIGSRALGLAVDLGTTNAAAFLVDLDTGKRLVSLGVENPQVAWGADLISRINAAVKSADTAEQLRVAAVNAINALAHDLCHAIGAQCGDILDLALCGNTAMHHLLAGLPVSQLGRAPFVADVRQGLDLKARDLGFSTAPGAYVHLAPNVGGFVGGDHVTALLASEERWSQGTSLVMDIGTNTEISLIHNGQFLTASAPSGPALEGGHIACGMRAAEGAIERVRLDEHNRLSVDVIGGKAAIGLCGSGVLDALATLHAAGIVDARGRIAAGHPDVGEIDGKRVALLAPDVYFSQDDVRAVQLAKAAIRTATELLLERAGLSAEHIEHFIIAGAFGAYIDVDSAIAIGLLPDLPRERFVQVGNAAGLGVRQMLASRQARARAAELAELCQYIELSTIAEFQKTFLKHIGFPKPGIPQQTTARIAA